LLAAERQDIRQTEFSSTDMRIIAAAIVLVVQSPVATPTDMPANFAIRLEGGACRADVADTRSGTYVRDLGTGATRSAKFSLPPAQLRQIYEWIKLAQFFEYPTAFNPPLTSITEPAPRYKLDVESGDLRHTVTWEDYGASTAEAARLRTLLHAIEKVFQELPAVKRLPRPDRMCL
jgi:hypothetical protein